MVPAGGFRGYGASQTTFAIECAMDELAKLLGINPIEIRRTNMIRPNDTMNPYGKIPPMLPLVAMDSTNVSILSRTRYRAAEDCRDPKATTGLKGPASRSP